MRRRLILKRASLLSLFTFISVAASFVSASASAPWDVHGRLVASAGQHDIHFEDGDPFLWIGDTAWGMAQQLRRRDIDHYLDDRKRLGFTVIQIVAFWYPHGGGLSTGPHNAANAYGFRPFSGGQDAPDVTKPLIKPGGGPDTPNDYWDNVDYIVTAAKKRGLYIALLPCWGRAYITAQFSGSHAVFTADQARIYGEFLGRRYGGEPNVIWVLGGDAKGQMRGYDNHSQFFEFDKRDVFRAMAEGLGRGATGKVLRWNKPNPAWGRIFITYHPDGDATVNSSVWFDEDAWLSANGVEIWREVDQVYSVMRSEYALSALVKPSLFLEGSYEYGSYRHECGWVTPLKTRRQFYHTFFAGGAGHTYGAGPVWAMRGDGGDYSCGYTWKRALAFPGARQIATIGKAFLTDHDWSDWTPAPQLVAGGDGKGESLKVGVTYQSGRAAAIYFSDNSSAAIRNILKGSVAMNWFDPRNGQTLPAGRLDVNQTGDVAPPADWEDAILVLTPAAS